MLKVLEMKCDWCELEAQSNEAGEVVVDGWIHVKYYDEFEEADFCDEHCLISFFTE